MADMNALISERLKKTEPSAKMAAMAQKSAAGGLTTFSGMFQVVELSFQEKETLEQILKTHAKAAQPIASDLKILIDITSEVKAINHQAALLHGERIQKAHRILTNYQEGAFSTWLLTVYGNRQTPYNLMQYFEFHQALPPPLRSKIEDMPRQAIYSLASRKGNFQEKLDFISNYQGETKNELLKKLRDLFPLNDKDNRKENLGELAIKLLKKAEEYILRKPTHLSKIQKDSLKKLLASLSSLIE